MTTSWLSKALEDLNRNIAHIAEESPQNAIHVLQTLIALADSLVDMPYKYPKEPVYNR